MRAKPATTISEGNLQFVRACFDALIAFHARWGIGRVHPDVTIKVSVNPSMLFRDDGKDAEMAIGCFHDDIAFLLIGSGERFPESLCFGHPRNREGEGCLFGTRCQPDELPEIIRAALEEHLQWTIASLQREIKRHEALHQRLLDEPITE